MLTIIDAVMVILTVTFLDETFWPRDGVHPVQKSRYLRLVGVEQRRTKLIPNSFFQAGKRLVVSLNKLPVLIGTNYYFFMFAWVIGNNITISVFIVAEYQFSYNQLAAIFVAPIVRGITGQVAGHWVHDVVARMYIKRHNGIIIPEARLILIYLVTPLYIIGMNPIGGTFQHHWHYMWLAFGWFLHNFSAVGITTALFAYLLDAYPEASGEVAAWLNVGRTSGGFVVGYVQIIWAGPNAQGIGREFAIQLGIVAASFFMMIFLHFWDSRLRKMRGPMKFRTQ